MSEHDASNVCPTHGYVRDVNDVDVDGVWPSCGTCGQELLTEAEVAERRAAESARPTAGIAGPARLTKLDADGQPTGESMLFGKDVTVTVDLTPTDAGVSPAEAHEIMQRVTGQPQYPTRAEMDAETRERLNGPWPGKSASAEPPPWQFRHESSFTVPPAPGRLGITAPEHPLGETPWGGIRNSAGELLRQSTFFDDELDEYFLAHHLAEARASEESLRAMGAKGDGVDLLFEMDSPSGAAPRLRVLLRNAPVPISVEAVLDRNALLGWPALAYAVGQAMAKCVKEIRRAVEAAQAATDPVTGEQRQTVEDEQP
jgi:hypothetical protein